jgi:heme-degrading monooxygenase HmoA
MPRHEEEVNSMIEVNMTYDFLPGIDQQAYGELARRAIATVLEAPGLVEFRASRNLLGSPQVRSSTVWRTLADWAKFSESSGWPALEAEFRTFVTNIRVDIWGPSAIVAEPLRPSK